MMEDVVHNQEVKTMAAHASNAAEELEGLAALICASVSHNQIKIVDILLTQ